MNAPVPLTTHELVLLRCPNPRAIIAHVCTHRANTWVTDCEPFFTSSTRLMIDMSVGCKLPLEYTLVVSLCYNVEDVLRYIADKPWAAIATPGQSETEAACATDPSADRTEPSP